MRKGRMPRERLTYANVVATLALFVAMGGSAYAVKQLPKNSVGPKQLRRGAVTGVKVKNRTLRAQDFRAGQLPAGPPGQQGPQGLQGPAGPSGPPGISGFQEVQAESPSNSTSPKSATVSCPGVKKVIGMGYENDGASTGPFGAQLKDIVTDQVFPWDNLTNVTATTYETHETSENWTVRVIAICANVN